MWIIKVMVFLGCLWFVSDKILDTDFSIFNLRMTPTQVLTILGVFLLMPINWGLEVYRWKLATPHENLTVTESMTAVLGGLAMNWVLPLTSGDLATRLSNVNYHVKTAWSIALVRGVSIFLTLVFGSLGLLYFFNYSLSWFWVIVGVSLVIVSIIFWKYQFQNQSDLVRVISVSVIRFLVFSFQFGLLIWAFNLELLIIQIAAGVGWVFLFRSVLPSLFGNFGVREASALVFFDALVPNSEMILIPTTLIWLVNTVIPSLIGAGLIFNLKVKLAQ